jgi:hypothetical protein
MAMEKEAYKEKSTRKRFWKVAGAFALALVGIDIITS